MDSSDETLKSLQNRSGIDFLALREKYKNKSKVGQVDPRKDEATADEASSKAAHEAHEELEKYKICQGCQGQGFVSYIYNHQKREKTCDVCDGESILYREDYSQGVCSAKKN